MKRCKVLALAVFAVLVLGAFGANFLRPATAAGEKSVTVTVEHLSGETAEFRFTTSAELLRAALEEQSLVSGEEREYGLWLITVDGETADESAQQWWGYTVNGDAAAYGVESQPVTDGDAYVFTLHEGW